MKKLLIPFLLCICRVAVSQGVEVGPLVGANFSWLTHKEGVLFDTRSSQTKLGIMAGAYVRIFVSKKFSIQPELMFASYGGKNKNYNFKLNYIALPVFARLNITPAFFVFTGPQAGLMVRANEYYIIKFKSTYFSYLLGAGYLFKESGLEISVRYNHGISIISKPIWFRDLSNQSIGSYNPDVRISSFQIVLAYRLFGGEKE